MIARRNLRLLAGAMLAVALGVGAAPLTAEEAEEEKNTIDCAETDLALDAENYEVECYDLSENSLNIGETFAAARASKLMASSPAEGTFLIVIDIRPLGNVYLKQRSLRADVENYFSGGSFKEWTGDSEIAGFEAEDFVGESNSGELLNCIGFRRKGARKHAGLGRLVVGMACTYNDRDGIHSALNRLTAPGG